MYCGCLMRFVSFISHRIQHCHVFSPFSPVLNCSGELAALSLSFSRAPTTLLCDGINCHSHLHRHELGNMNLVMLLTCLISSFPLQIRSSILKHFSLKKLETKKSWPLYWVRERDWTPLTWFNCIYFSLGKQIRDMLWKTTIQGANEQCSPPGPAGFASRRRLGLCRVAACCKRSEHVHVPPAGAGSSHSAPGLTCGGTAHLLIHFTRKTPACCWSQQRGNRLHYCCSVYFKSRHILLT